MIFRSTIVACCIWLSAAVQAQAIDPEDIGTPATARQDVSKLSVPELRKKVSEAYQAENFTLLRDALVALGNLRPYNSEYMFQLVLANALLDDKAAAYDTMLKMQRQGLSYDFDKAPESQNIRGTELYEHLNGLMVSAANPLGDASVVARLAAEVLLPDSIAWDASREAFLVGTITDGLILQVDADGQSRELLRASEENGLWGVYGLAVDSARNRLYASSASNPQFRGGKKEDQGRSMLVEFQLDTMEILHRYPVPADGRPHILGKLVIDPAGKIFATDALLPMVYVLEPGEPALRPYFNQPYFVSLRGMDLSENGRLLYLADHEMGITVIEIASARSVRLKGPETLNLGGIDGLSVWGNSLVIVQSGISPQRVMRLDLDPTGTSVSAIAPMAVALDIFDTPRYGEVRGDEFFFLANSHWGKDEPSAVTIARINIAETPTMVDPQLEQLLDQYRKSQAAGMVRPGDSLPGEGEKKD
ncbi:MAG: hypothetical protein HKO64_00355 [Xanthomonadales bacterium]|nr:hypothetical protein [Gammaproteobacteria bacterium]NNE06287.1 hypothetical protein [Xanthomonadales bacterium]NNL94046.1 hypothetical protein [Xanthomonadales bacterium]